MKSKSFFTKHLFLNPIFYFVIIFSNSCQKSQSSNDLKAYTFHCEVDGKVINLSYKVDVINTGVAMSATASSLIKGDVASSRCSDPGTYCIVWVMELQQQTIGTYNPTDFHLVVTIGNTPIVYSYSSLYSSGNVKVNITKIQHGTNSPLKLGVLEGSFSGTITKQSNGVVTMIPITGNFSLPLAG